MATIDDLDLESISDMSTDEALDLLRQIRLGRRTKTAQYKTSKVNKPKAPKQQVKLNADQAAELLKILGG